jgi:hypothetical protein
VPQQLATTGNSSTPEASTDWGKLRRMRAEDIKAEVDADPDARGTDDAFWQNAQVVWRRSGGDK